MATAKQLKAAILARGAPKGRRGKRTRPEPRQYTVYGYGYPAYGYGYPAYGYGYPAYSYGYPAYYGDGPRPYYGYYAPRY